MKVLIFALAFVALVCAVTVPSDLLEDPHHALFVNFIQTYGKKYDNSEYLKRFLIFKENHKFVEHHNKERAAELGFTVAMNKFGDLAKEEFASLYNNYISGLRTPTPAEEKVVNFVDLPASVDWRTEGAVTPVKNQEQCGSCWSFSTTGSVEGAWKLAGHPLVSLSEQQLVDCSQSYGNAGCNGGLMDDAFQYIIKQGSETEACYPYTAQDGTCAYKSSCVVAHISSYKDIPTGSESALQAAAAQQPVSVAIDAGESSFQFYSSGVYYEPSCSATDLDHGVLVIGYGTDGGKDFWLVKNSWGTDWGMNGYIEMARNRNNNCGIATEASYPIV